MGSKMGPLSSPGTTSYSLPIVAIGLPLTVFAVPSFQLGTVTLAGWLVGGKSRLSVRAINRSTSKNGALRYHIY